MMIAQPGQITAPLRYRNRFIRITLSKHLWDLKIIALLAVLITVPLIYFWVSVWFISTQNTSELDEVADTLYAAVACLDQHSAQIGSAAVKSLDQARDDLAKTRGKIQYVDSYLLGHIQKPIRSLQGKLELLGKDLSGSSKIPGDVFDDNCADRYNNLTSDQIQSVGASIPALASAIRRLASSLTAGQSMSSIWTILGAFLTATLTFGGWLYRTGDTRLTSIDIIASEIFSLCRAMANNQSMKNLALLYDSKEIPYSLAYLELTEKYDDFMEDVGQSLGFLDQFTISRITGFYTSIKIARDRFRMLKNWAADAASEKPTLAAKNDLFLKTTVKQLAYDFFLCLENARIAMHLLLEGDGFHNDCIFVSLLSEIRVLSFLMSLKDNSPYIARRLEARFESPAYKTHEELESYFHPAYEGAVQKVCDSYREFYVDGIGMDLIERLRAGPVVQIPANRQKDAPMEDGDCNLPHAA